MKLGRINHVIKEMCTEIDLLADHQTDWKSYSEDELIYEMTVCVFGSQMLFEVAVAAAERLKANGLLCCDVVQAPPKDHQILIETALSQPLDVEVNNVWRTMRPRFKRRLSILLGKTFSTIHTNGNTIRDILISAHSAIEARSILVEKIAGFGPKQASLFLRRVGYCSELAVLDTHIVDYLELAHGSSFKKNALSRLHTYERIEAEFLRVADYFGHATGCVDLAMWITMRVAKREAMV